MYNLSLTLNNFPVIFHIARVSVLGSMEFGNITNAYHYEK